MNCEVRDCRFYAAFLVLVAGAAMNLFALLVAWLLGNFGRGMRWQPVLVSSGPRGRGLALPVERTATWAAAMTNQAGNQPLLAALGLRMGRTGKLSGSVRFSYSDARFAADGPLAAITTWLGSRRSKTG